MVWLCCSLTGMGVTRQHANTVNLCTWSVLSCAVTFHDNIYTIVILWGERESEKGEKGRGRVRERERERG